MKYWEFLIQKEGDQTWLPLETEQVEILEGRYRVVAHTDRSNTPMDIRVSQLVTGEVPPRKRVRKRAGQTNEAGLVVVMPFVHLKPGQWELQCSSVDEADAAAGWRYNVQLQVFAHTEEDWSGEWPVPEDSGSAGQESDADDGSIEADGLTNQDLPLIQAQAELEAQLQNRGLNALGLTNVTVPDEYSYGVALRQQAYLAHHNQPMTIMGKVDSRSDAVHEQTSQLWIRLQNPETAQVIMEAHRPLSLSRLPADFKVQIQLPTEVTTRVILGEVSLRTAALAPEEKVQILASTAFTITAGIAQLLDAIANQDTGIFDEDVSELPATEPELAVPSLTPTQNSFVPAIGVVLPPQLALSESGFQIVEQQAIQNEPNLPSFGSFYNGIAYDDKAANLLVSDSPETLSATVSESEVDYIAADAPLSAEETLYDASGEIADDGLPALIEQPLIEDLTVAVEASESAAADDTPTTQSEQLESTQPQDERDVQTGPPLMPPIEPDNAYFPPANPLNNDPVLPASTAVDLPSAKPIESVESVKSEVSRRMMPIERPPMVTQPAQFLGTSIEDSDLEADEIAAVLEDIDQNLRSTESDLDALEAPGIEGSLPSSPTSPIPASEEGFIPTARNPYPTELSSERLSEEAKTSADRSADRSLPRSVTDRRQSTRQVEANVDFQALKLKDHFWNRLSTLTHESHQQATQIAKGMQEAGVTRGAFSTLSTSTDLVQDEVVIYDEPSNESPSKPAAGDSLGNQLDHRLGGQLGGQLIEHRQPMGQSGTQQKGYDRLAPMEVRSPRTSASQPLVRPQPAVPEDLPEMALPVISIPVGDLVAGAKIAVMVRTRPATYKPFIKLWMVDRQSRSLVIDPQLLTNLRPNVVGDLEATAEMRVPMDCLDVQIAAIAVDMATQQESGKAVVNRHVIPAGQASSSNKFSF